MADFDLNDINIDELVNDREKFNAFVYTPVDEAVRQFQKRQDDLALKKYVEKSLPVGVPEILLNRRCAFLSRDLATPNYETRRFISIVDAIDNFVPVFWEYVQDKFTPNLNKLKHALGKMTFYFGRGKNGGEKIQKINIVDFNLYSGQRINEVKTLWGQGLVDFHHELFNKTSQRLKDAIIFDASDWYLKSGRTVDKYYKNIFILFLRNGILFENFIIDEEREASFVKKIFLPAFIEIQKECGIKPLVVSLEPTDLEGQDFWNYYPSESFHATNEKIMSIKL